MGRIHHHASVGKPIPAGWAVDAMGQPTTDAQAAKSGAIPPFGAAKGYGLGLAVELLVASLAGSDFTPEARGTLDDAEVANMGDMIVLIDPLADDGPGASLAAYLDPVRGSRPLDPLRPVAIPADGMRARRAESLSADVELLEPLHSDLTALAGR